MTVSVAEIGGRAVAALNADCLDEALEVMGPVSAFAEDAIALESDGAPVWDGETPIHIREAEDEERNQMGRISPNGDP